MTGLVPQNIINRVASQLVDPQNITWSRTELLEWLSVGQRLIIMLQPSATNTIVTIKLAAGSRQSIPSDGWILLDVIRNMGPNGAISGKVIRPASRRLLDSFNSSWLSDSPSSVVTSYVYDLQDQTAFFVYPPSDGTNYIEINYSSMPAWLTNETTAMALNPSYEEALINYVMFRALSKNAAFAANPEADKYLAMFNAMLGAKVSSEQANNPNTGLFPSSPSNTGGVS